MLAVLWAITSYFNPARYANRLRNYRIFRANLAVPLAVVELSLDGRFELRQDDADIVVQIVGGAVAEGTFAQSSARLLARGVRQGRLGRL